MQSGALHMCKAAMWVVGFAIAGVGCRAPEESRVNASVEEASCEESVSLGVCEIEGLAYEEGEVAEGEVASREAEGVIAESEASEHAVKCECCALQSINRNCSEMPKECPCSKLNQQGYHPEGLDHCLTERECNHG